MIIYEDGKYETRSDKPNEDWTGKAKYIIDESTENGKYLADRISNLYPHYELIISNGKIIEVKENIKIDIMINLKKEEIRGKRNKYFDAFDIYKSNLAYGIETEIEEKQAIVAWYQEWLNLPEMVTSENYNTIEYPATPAKIKKYLK